MRVAHRALCCAALLALTLGTHPCSAEIAAAQTPTPKTTRIDFVEFSSNASLSGAVLQDAVKSWLGRDLSVAQMNRIKEINADDFVAVVEPGVITGKLQAEVAWSPKRWRSRRSFANF